jgi:hypothetical protein
LSDKSLKSELPKCFRADQALEASASAQLTKAHLANILKKIGREDCPGTVTVVDLRQESHGFADGIPFSWYRCRNLINFGKTRSGALFSETEALDNLQENINKGYMPVVTLHEIRVKLLGSVYTAEESKLEGPVKIESEEQICESLGVKYVRFPVVDHHHPDEIVADAFAKYITGLLCKSGQDSKDAEHPEKQQWLHFHCKGGRGRSTSFIAMYNMMVHCLMKTKDNHNSANSQSSSESCLNKAEDFIEKQHKLGGSDLSKAPRCKNKQWKMAAFKNRNRFLKNFFDYCQYLSNALENEVAAEDVQGWYDWIDNKLSTSKASVGSTTADEQPMSDE